MDEGAADFTPVFPDLTIGQSHPLVTQSRNSPFLQKGHLVCCAKLRQPVLVGIVCPQSCGGNANRKCLSFDPLSADGTVSTHRSRRRSRRRIRDDSLISDPETTRTVRCGEPMPSLTRRSKGSTPVYYIKANASVSCFVCSPLDAPPSGIYILCGL